MRSKIVSSFLVLSLLGIFFSNSVFAETKYTNSSSSVNYDGGTIENQDVSIESDLGKCDVSVSQTSTFSVIIPKTIVLNGSVGSSNEAEYTVEVNGNIASNEVITVNPETEFSMYDQNNIKPSKAAKVIQSVLNFVESETKNTNLFVNDSQYTSLTRASESAIGIGSCGGKVVVENLTAGNWAGYFNFVISLTNFNVEEG